MRFPVSYCPTHGLQNERSECIVCSNPTRSRQVVVVNLALLESARMVHAIDQTIPAEERDEAIRSRLAELAIVLANEILADPPPSASNRNGLAYPHPSRL